MNSNLEQFKAMKEEMLDHLDALKDEEFKLWGLALEAGAPVNPELDVDVPRALNNLEKAIQKLRNELMFYMNDRIEAEENADA